MNLRPTLAAFALLVTAALGTGCNADNCARTGNWRNCDSNGCTGCRNDHCSAYFNAFLSSTCNDDRNCVTNCLGSSWLAGDRAFCNQGDNSRCSCAENCLRTQVCADAFNSYFSCSVQYCESVCQ